MNITGGENETKFQEALEQLGRKHERSVVYRDFMDYYIIQNSKHDTLPLGYTDEEMQLFHTAYTSFKDMMMELIEKHGWYDYIGEYYEEYILAGSKASEKGQFYTPRGISDLLSKMIGTPVELSEAYDPACGSCRNLLDYHCKHPGVRLVGEDLDESACKMGVVNFHVHGVDGVINWIDALTREYMGTSWRILGGKIYVTDLDWIRAVDDLVDGVSILSLSDDTVRDLLGVASVAMRDAQSGVNTMDSDNRENVGGGLDAWM